MGLSGNRFVHNCKHQGHLEPYVRPLSLVHSFYLLERRKWSMVLVPLGGAVDILPPVTVLDVMTQVLQNASAIV